MDAYMQAKILEALGKGDLKETIAWLAIFFLIWFQLSGVKKEVKALNKTIGDSHKFSETKFALGELRFEAHEKIHKEFEHRITVLEKNKE